jgi:hypothetical protein
MATMTLKERGRPASAEMTTKSQNNISNCTRFRASTTTLSQAGESVDMYNRIRSALSFIDAGERDAWVRMGMVVKSELGDAGFDLWECMEPPSRVLQ